MVGAEPRAVVILGPTAVGKSRLALTLAERLGGEIVSADAMQVYKGLDIGTDKPSWADRQRVAHHLIDVSPPDMRFNVVHFRRLALDAVQAILARDHRPIVVGGSGLYLRALMQGYTFPGGPPRPGRERIAARIRDDPELRARIRAENPAARSLPDADTVRLVRAWEALGPSVPLVGAPLAVSAVIGLMRPRAQLYARIDARAARQVERGIFDEVADLLRQGYRSGPLQGLVYREALWYVQGRVTRAEYLRLVSRNTRRLAKRQLTWFRRERGVTWLDATDPQLAERAFRLIRAGDAAAVSNP